MFRVSQNVLPTLVVAAISLVSAGALHAYPTTSPSARGAVRLKYHPPQNYLRHYLPDDRFKIGNIWKTVSTEIDTDYHRPNCPLMLSEPAGGVIGFFSAGDSLEAGYHPCPTCRPEVPVVIYAPAARTSSTSAHSAPSVSPESQNASRIVNFLADKIQNTSERGDLLLISVVISNLQDGVDDETVRSILQGQSLRFQTLETRTDSLGWLQQAINNKLNPYLADLRLWRRYLQNARELVRPTRRPTTPQTQAQLQQKLNNQARGLAWQGGRR